MTTGAEGQERSGDRRAPTGPPRAELVRWPAEAERRVELAGRQVPCLLVLAPGAPIPPLGSGEDWIRADAHERDVAVRLRHLTEGGRPPGPPLLVLPAGLLVGPARRVADRLASAGGGFVARPDLEAIAWRGDTAGRSLEELLDEVRVAVERLGWSVTAVSRAGYLLETVGAAR